MLCALIHEQDKHRWGHVPNPASPCCDTNCGAVRMTHLLLATIGKNAQACPHILAPSLGERCKHLIIRVHESGQRNLSALAFPLLSALTEQTRKFHLPGLQRITVLALPYAMLSQRKEQHIVERKRTCHMVTRLLWDKSLSLRLLS